MSDDIDKWNRDAEAAARLSWQLDLYRHALKLIRDFGDKTLISASGNRDTQTAYSLGAARAFEQCAGIARDALTEGENA